MIETYPAPARSEERARQELVTASYARLSPDPYARGEYTSQTVFTDQATFWTRREGVENARLAALESRSTWWPVVLIVLLACVAGVALFG